MLTSVTSPAPRYSPARVQHGDGAGVALRREPRQQPAVHGLPAARARPSAEPGSSSAAARAAAPIAGPATYASRQPWLGQLAGHLRPVHVDDDVADLGGRAAGAALRAAAADDAAAHARAQREHEHLADAHAGAVDVLADARRRRRRCRSRRARRSAARRRSRSGTSVSGRLTDSTTRPRGEVDHRRDAHADALHRARAVLEVGDAGLDAAQARLGRAASVSVVNRSQDLAASPPRRASALRARAAATHERRGHLGAADVDADDGALRGHDVPELTMV